MTRGVDMRIYSEGRSNTLSPHHILAQTKSSRGWARVRGLWEVYACAIIYMHDPSCNVAQR